LFHQLAERIHEQLGLVLRNGNESFVGQNLAETGMLFNQAA
jgi:hypothetical protein